jgi:RimJ/RimL family protein N-acetyltransferase
VRAGPIAVNPATGLAGAFRGFSDGRRLCSRGNSLDRPKVLMSSPMSAPRDPAERRPGAVAAGGLASDEECVVLPDGSQVVIRRLAAGDEATIDVWFEGLGPETRYARFLAPLKLLDRRTRWSLAQLDHRDREAIAAVGLDGSIAGIVRYMRAPDASTAEVAVAVVDRWAGRGVATVLLDRIAARARAVGIRRFTAVCLASNDRIIRLLRRLGPATIDHPDAGVVELRIDLTARRR